ncbi:MAG: Calx-beta domain-containing protein [Candidatus Thiodiazotropha sp.]
MMLNRFITAVIWSGLFFLPALSGAVGITANVDKLIAKIDYTSKIPVIVKFKKDNNIHNLRNLINKKHQYEPSQSKSQSKQKKQLRRRLLTSLKEQLSTPKAKLAKTLRNHGVKTRLKSLWAINAVALEIPADLVDEIATMPDVERITIDMQLTMSENRVDVLATESLWNLNNIKTEQLWQQGISGEGVTVAIMDSGVDLNHPDLIDKWRGGTNSWFDPYQQNEQPTDVVGHGTQALGIILGGDASGYQIGMAPEATWIAAKIFDNANESTLSAIHESFQWLLDPDGDPLTDDAPDLVNNSWGFSTTINECFQEFNEDIQLLREVGIGVVFSAGNFGPSAESSISPANDPGAISVGSVDQSNEVDLLSSRGPGACDGGVFPKLVAPGSLVFTSDLLPTAYNVVSGTSFAAPHVTGAMALLKSAYPEASPSQIETALYESAVDLGDPGTDDNYGYGLLDVAAAYSYLKDIFGSSENGLIEFSDSFYSVDEDTEKLIVTVRRSGGSKGEVAIDYTTVEGDAVQGRDFALSRGTLHFNDGETIRNFEVTIHDDRLDELNENFHLMLSNVSGSASLGKIIEAEVMILDNDGAGSVSFDSVAYAVNESKHEVFIDVNRIEGSTGVVDISYEFIDQSADAGLDYISDAKTLHFLSGETKKQIRVELIDDEIFEGNETFQLLLTPVSDSATIVEPATTTVTILDDDPDTGSISFLLSAVSYDVSESSNKISITINRSGNLEALATVKYKTIDGSAKKRKDYLEASGTLTFPPGVSRRTVSIEIIDDGLYEEESSFSIQLHDASGNATVSTPSAAIIRIIDNEALPFVSINAAPISGSVNRHRSTKSGKLNHNKGSTLNNTSGPNSERSGLQFFDINLHGYSDGDTKGIQELLLRLKDSYQAPTDKQAKSSEEEGGESNNTHCSSGTGDGNTSVSGCSDNDPTTPNHDSNASSTPGTRIDADDIESSDVDKLTISEKTIDSIEK